MNARGRAIAGVVIMSVLLVLYFGFAGLRAVALLQTATPISVVMGIALLILPLIGAWALARELMFGYRSTALIDQLAAENLLPDDLGEAGPTGKPDRAVANAAFAKYQAETESDSEEWRSWARLGIVYDACGDRTRARAALRTAISYSRNEFGRAARQD